MEDGSKSSGCLAKAQPIKHKVLMTWLMVQGHPRKSGTKFLWLGVVPPSRQDTRKYSSAANGHTTGWGV